ncbi:hypothetical protein HOY80DRAFT_1098905 [Tuber brumale]|nr:hypothetical protein HOY80DRAFT_1098905 [Tuber brumale]
MATSHLPGSIMASSGTLNQFLTCRDLAVQLLNAPAPPPRQASPVPPEQTLQYQQLQQHCNLLTQEQDEARTVHQGLEARLVIVEASLTPATATITSLNTALALMLVPGAAAPAGGNKQVSITDPEQFDSATERLRPFITQLRMKLQGDAHRFTGEQTVSATPWAYSEDVPTCRSNTQHDNNVRARAAKKKGSSLSSWGTSTPAAPRTPAAPPAFTSTATGTAPGPMDLSAGRWKLTTTERQDRINRSLCLYCGGHGYMARACPNKGPRPMHGASTHTVPAPEEPLPAQEESEN